MYSSVIKQKHLYGFNTKEYVGRLLVAIPKVAVKGMRRYFRAESGIFVIMTTPALKYSRIAARTMYENMADRTFTHRKLRLCHGNVCSGNG